MIHRAAWAGGTVRGDRLVPRPRPPPAALLLVGLLAWLSLLAAPLLPPRHSEPPPASLPGLSAVQPALARLPLYFEANAGQAGPRVQFRARGPGYTLALTPTEAVFRLRTSVLPEAPAVAAPSN